jgi:hypothetical protein
MASTQIQQIETTELQTDTQSEIEFEKLKKTTQSIPTTVTFFDRDLNKVIDEVDNTILKYLKTQVFTNGIPKSKHTAISKIFTNARTALTD